MSDRGKEQLIQELEAILAQLREGSDQAAAATAAGLLLQGKQELVKGDLDRVPAVGEAKASKAAKPKQSLRKRVRRFLIRTVLVLVALGAITIGVYSYLAKQNEPTVSMFVTGVQGISKLATAEAYVMTTIEGQDNKIFGKDITTNFPGTKRHYMIIVPAKILSGVDLQHVSESDIQINHNAKTVEITLPHAEIIEDAVQMDDVKVYTDEGLLRGATTAKEGVDLIAQASVKERLRQQAKDAGILKTAEENATQALQKLYDQLGYHVIVTYR